MLYDFCARHGVPHARCGKLIVADDEEGMAELERLLALGTANGVPGLTPGGRRVRREREPHVRASAALFSPSTGIVDAEALVRTLARLCAEHGRLRAAWVAAPRCRLSGQRHRAAHAFRDVSPRGPSSMPPDCMQMTCRGCLAERHSRSIRAEGNTQS